MTRPGALPRVVQVALHAPGAKCYRHCERRAFGHPLTSSLPGRWTVYACPSRVVSLVAYVEWTNRNPTARVRAFLRRRTVPSSLVRLRDLRLATRHGPELGEAAERLLADRRPKRKIRVVYWRVYPFTAADGSERRLFICRGKRHERPVFYAAAPARGKGECPVCARLARKRDVPQAQVDRARAPPVGPQRPADRSSSFSSRERSAPGGTPRRLPRTGPGR